MYRVLVFSRDLDWYGGVVNFVSTLKKYLDPEYEYEHFIIGQRKENRFWLVRPLVPALDAVRLFRFLGHKSFNAYHLNPSLNVPSLLRDGLFLLVLRWRRARNVVVVFHGWDSALERKISASRLLSRIFLYVFGYADKVLVLADDFGKWLEETGFEGKKIRLFTTMFDSEEFSGLSETARDDCRLIFLSRFVREKGMFELVDAFRELRAIYRSLTLVLAGTGPEETALRNYVEQQGLGEHVIFTGYLRGHEKAQALSGAGIFVFPTYYGEGCPVSLLEAMAAGLPVITTTAGGIPHIVEDGRNGLVLPEVSPGSIGAAVRKLVDNRELRDEIGSRNRKEAWEKYSAQAVARYFERIYRESNGHA